jgi:hypothetical protein
LFAECYNVALSKQEGVIMPDFDDVALEDAMCAGCQPDNEWEDEDDQWEDDLTIDSGDPLDIEYDR